MLLLFNIISRDGVRSQSASDDNDRLSLSFNSDLGQRLPNFQVTILGTFFN